MIKPSTPPITTVYGIPNCSTVKKARAWLDEHGVAYTFHDFKKLGVPPDSLWQWIETLSWEKLVNQRGNTWRALDDDTRRAVINAGTAHTLMLAHPSVIKRPVVGWPDGRLSVGFDSQSFSDHLP